MTHGSVTLDGRRYPARTVVRALEPHLLPERFARMRHVVERRLGSVALGVEDLHKGHNGAACLRTAEALGIQDVVAAELRNPYPLPADDAAETYVNRKVSMAAHNWIDLHPVDTSDALLAWARARDMRVFGAGPRATLTLDSLPIDGPLLVLFGNERAGLRDTTLAACDDTFRIPMYGFTESFNVSVSVGMALSAVTTRVRTRLAADDRTGDLPPDRLWTLFARWCIADMRGAGAIVRRKLGQGDEPT